MSWDTSPKSGLFYVLLTSKGGNIAFTPPSPPCNVVPMFELPIKNNKNPNFEWRGQGRGADSFVLLSYPIWVQCLNNFLSPIVGLTKLDRCRRIRWGIWWREPSFVHAPNRRLGTGVTKRETQESRGHKQTLCSRCKTYWVSRTVFST